MTSSPFMKVVRGLLPLLCAVLVGCGGPSVVVVSVSAEGVPPISQIRVTMSNARTSSVRVYPQVDAPATIQFPTSLAIVVPHSRSGALDLALEGLGAAGQVVAHGTASIVINVGGRTDVSVTLMPGPSPCGNGRPDANEECDDHNLVSGDGCDVVCHREPVLPDAAADDSAAASDGSMTTPGLDAAAGQGGAGGGSPATGGTSGGGSGGAPGTANCSMLQRWQAGALYGGGALVTNGQPLHKYECKPYPFEGWCSNPSFEPGRANVPWMDAWIDHGQCDSGSGSGGTGGGLGGVGGGPSLDLRAGLVSHWKFDEGTGTATADSAGAGNTGSLTGGFPPRWTGGGAPIPQNPFSLSLDGVDGYVALQKDLAPALGGTSSLSCWIKTTQTGSNNSYDAPGITGIESGGGSNDIFWGFIDAAGSIGLRPGSGRTVKSLAPVNDDRWHHIVMTRDQISGRIQIFVDGKIAQADDGMQTGPKSTPFSSLGRITGSSMPYFKGQLDDIRIWSRVLDASEVSALFAGM